VLTDGKGRTLYVYMPEKGGKVACTGGCASLWPPMKSPSGGKPATTSAVHPNLVGTVADPSGGTIVTYAGWPLHTYASDTGPGVANGQGVDGKWYVISPSGQVITKPVGSATSTTTTSTSTSGGYGSGY
jgi:predicted lipoprotein with Yx(FWY)xxD motif